MADVSDGNLPGRAYHHLLEAFGKQQWWPAETAFEVLVGAVLTQNAAWRNVEQALARLSEQKLLTPEAILSAPSDLLRDCLRPSGYYNVKAQRLIAACEAWVELGGEAGVGRMETAALRERLLAVKGLGPESVDDVLLYGLGRPVFVVDAYTRRIFSRIGAIAESIDYQSLQDFFHAGLPSDAALYAEYHALIVNAGKHHCRPRLPRCEDCPLISLCDYAQLGA